MFCISVSSLFWYHVYLVLSNRSTLEQFRAPYFATGPDENGWGLGKRNNFQVRKKSVTNSLYFYLQRATDDLIFGSKHDRKIAMMSAWFAFGCFVSMIGKSCLQDKRWRFIRRNHKKKKKSFFFNDSRQNKLLKIILQNSKN